MVDGVEVTDLVGFGRNHTVAEGSCRWRGAVCSKDVFFFLQKMHQYYITINIHQRDITSQHFLLLCCFLKFIAIQNKSKYLTQNILNK